MPQNYKNQPSINRFNFIRWYQDKNLLANAEFAIGAGNNFTNWTKTIPTHKNLLLFTHEFDNPVWSKSNVTVTPNSTNAINGTLTADTLSKNTVGVDGVVSQVVAISDNLDYTYSLYVLKDNDETRFPEFILRNGSGDVEQYVQLNTKTGATNVRVSVGSVSHSVEVDGLYWRIILTNYATTISPDEAIFGIRPAVGTVLGEYDENATGSIIVYGAQLEQNSEATTYSPNTNVAVTTDDGTITAGTRENILKYSDDLSNVVWTEGNVTATAGDITGLAGNLFKYVFHQLSAPLFGYYTLQLKAKYDTHRYIQILWSGEGQYTNIDLLDGVTSDSTGVTSTIKRVADGYFYITVTIYALVTDGHFISIIDSLASARASSTTSINTVKIKNQQLQVGNIATDYIPTTSSAVTIADGLNLTRCVRLERGVTPGLAIVQSSVLGSAGDYKLSFWAKKGSNTNSAIKLVSESSTFDTIPVETIYYQKYSVILPALTPDNQIALYNDVANSAIIIDNVRLELVQEGVCIGPPQPYVLDGDRQSFPILTPTDYLQFYINANTPITDLTKTDLVPVLYNEKGVRVYAWSTSVLDEVTVGAGSHYFSSALLLSVLSGIPQGLYYLAIYNTSTGNVLFTSNYMLYMETGYEDISSHVTFRHYKNLFGVQYYTLINFYQKLRIMLLEKEIVYGGEINQYREITTGTVRMNSTFDERILKAETYYFDREQHEAMDAMCRHESLTINSKSYIAKGSYNPNITQTSRISKGEVELIDQEFSQQNS